MRAKEPVKQRGKRRDGSVRTRDKCVNVEFTRTTSPRLVAPASPIWLLFRLEGSPKQTTNPHVDQKCKPHLVGAIWWKASNKSCSTKMKASGRECSHSRQVHQHGVHSNRISEAGGSRVADSVVIKAARYTCCNSSLCSSVLRCALGLELDLHKLKPESVYCR
jgi:hypothetical protein